MGFCKIIQNYNNLWYFSIPLFLPAFENEIKLFISNKKLTNLYRASYQNNTQAKCYRNFVWPKYINTDIVVGSNCLLAPEEGERETNNILQLRLQQKILNTKDVLHYVGITAISKFFDLATTQHCPEMNVSELSGKCSLWDTKRTFRLVWEYKSSLIHFLSLWSKSYQRFLPYIIGYLNWPMKWNSIIFAWYLMWAKVVKEKYFH